MRVFFIGVVVWIQIYWIWIPIQNFCQFKSGSRVFFINWRKKKIEKNNFLQKIFFLNYRKIIVWEVFSQLSLWMVNSCPKSYTFCFSFILYFHVWIRIHKAHEYGSNTDPDPQHWFYCCWSFIQQLQICQFKFFRKTK